MVDSRVQEVNEIWVCSVNDDQYKHTLLFTVKAAQQALVSSFYTVNSSSSLQLVAH